MKKLGLLGGTSYPSTMLYYQRLNQLVQQRLGGFHSCPMLLYNIDYHGIKSLYPDGWDQIPRLLKKELKNLLSLQPDGLIICNNTLHKAFDMIRHELPQSVPVFHVIELTIRYLQQQQISHVLLLGTRFTMEDGFFKDALTAAGIRVGIPDATERDAIQQIQSQLATGVTEPGFIAYFQQLCDKYAAYEGIILACTELPLAFTEVVSKPLLINTLELQCLAGVDFVLEDYQP